MFENCAICGCRVHRIASTYAQASIAGRSHAARHHYVAERFFGRSKSRRGVSTEGIFLSCPWKQEGEFGIFCYECHEELLRNPVLLAQDVEHFAELVKWRGLGERHKTESRAPIAGRVALLHEVIALGISAALKREASLARKQAMRELVPFLGGFAVALLVVGFHPWINAYAAGDSVASFEGWLFFLAGLLGCASSPGRPFRAAGLGAIGVLLGTAGGVIVGSVMGGGPENDFLPLEVASHAAMAAPCFLLSALLWKLGSAPIFWDVRELRRLANERIEAKRQALFESASREIESLKGAAAASASAAVGESIQRIVTICSNALYALAEEVLSQYDGVLAQPLIPGPFTVEGLTRAVPNQLQPLQDECIGHLRRETNLAGVPHLAVKCIAMLEARCEAICTDAALTLRASVAQRNRDRLRHLASLLSGMYTKWIGSASA